LQERVASRLAVGAGRAIGGDPGRRRGPPRRRPSAQAIHASMPALACSGVALAICSPAGTEEF